jgi:predicted ribosome quality control (RQC) complex YloA/Tae2 family protein
MCVCVMKTSMTNFDIAAILPELRKHTIGGRIHNVYQITPEAFLFKIHPANLSLVIEPAKRIHLTRFEVKTPAKPSQLCMAFRKYVRSAKIADMQQPNFERLVSIGIERHGERHRIVVELLPRGNIILTDDQNKVIVSSKYIRMKDRNILRGQPLRLPPQRGKNLLVTSVSQIVDLRKLGKTEAVKAFSQAFGVGGVFAEEILQRAGVDKSLPANDLSDAQIEKLFRAISELKDAIEAGAQSPAIVLDNDRMIDVTPFELERYKDMRKKTYASFNDAVDEYFTAVSSARQIGERESSYIVKRQQLERRLDAQKSQLQEITNSAEILRTMGDLIFRHLNEIQAVLEIVVEHRRLKQSIEEITRSLLKEGTDGSKAYPYVHEVTSRGDKVTFVFDGTQIELLTRRKPQDQAADYYRKAKHLEAKLSGLEASTKETQLLLEKLATKEVELKQPTPPELRPEKVWFEKFRWFHSSEGLLIVGGRDAASNETLLKRYTDPQDLVMHAEVHGAPFFVVKTGRTEAKPETLREAAQACVSYSRLWKEGVQSGDAYWVRPEQVTKSAPPGEYLSRGAFMIRGTRNYLRGIELRLAVGLASYDGRFLVMAGPPTAVRSKCQVFTEIRQGRGSPAEVTRKILAILRYKATETLRTYLTRITTDEVMRLLPPGGVETMNSISP